MRFVHIVLSPEKEILGCFSSGIKACKFADKYHKENFIRPNIKPYPIK